MATEKRKLERQRKLVQAGREALSYEARYTEAVNRADDATLQVQRLERDLERAQWELEQATKQIATEQDAVDSATQAYGALGHQLEQARIDNRQLAQEVVLLRGQRAKMLEDDHDSAKLRRRLMQAKVQLTDQQQTINRLKRVVSASNQSPLAHDLYAAVAAGMKAGDTMMMLRMSNLLEWANKHDHLRRENNGNKETTSAPTSAHS